MMSVTRRLRLTFLSSRSDEGYKLCQKFKRLVEAQGHELRCPEATTSEAFRATYTNDDIIFVDMTREHQASQHNYHLIIPSQMNHIIVVSRNYLPLNFPCSNDSILDGVTKEIYYNAPLYRGVLSNDHLLQFMNLQIRAASKMPPRRKFGAITGMLKGVTQMAFGKFDLGKQDQERQQSGQVFISFRSADAQGVEKLKQRIERSENNDIFPGGKSVRFFPPGIISNELFTEWRRWQVLSMLNNFIGPADEFWIYKSTGDAGQYYFNSWWTLCELMSIAHRQVSGYRGKKDWRIRLYDEATDNITELTENFFPSFSSEQEQRLSRWFTYTDVSQMGIESIARSPKPLGMEQDHVNSRAFWTDFILDCPNCRTLGKNANRFSIDDLLWHRGANFTRLPAETVRISDRSNQGISISCGNKVCRKTYNVRRDEPHYLHLLPILDRKDIAVLQSFFEGELLDDQHLMKIDKYDMY